MPTSVSDYLRRKPASIVRRAVHYCAPLHVGRSEAPEALRRADLPRDYVLIIGVRGDDGTLHLLHEPVTEDDLVREAVATLVP
jgi:hypothetical protein